MTLLANNDQSYFLYRVKFFMEVFFLENHIVSYIGRPGVLLMNT